ncbi:MAG: sugar transferase [Thermoleophilia bacterium]|nr:sugar transferase [Thermoleophilia bacterium]MDH4345978.1 sugar transferase [Thermoleophilia bacterium]
MSDRSSEAVPNGTRRAKRTLDLTVCGMLLVLLSPVLAGVWAAVALDALLSRRDRGPILYREPRISAGREFDLLKFRTLRREVLTEARGHVRPFEADAGNLTWAARRVLKPWYLDELPQLVNVLRGDMSLVGPRPWPGELVEQQVARGYDYRLRVPAGWTGPAQVSKGGDPARYAELDLGYVALVEAGRPWRLVRADLGLLRRTVATMLRGEGLAN